MTAGLLTPRRMGSFYSIIDLEVDQYSIPSTLTGGVIGSATFSTALATSMFTTGQGTPAGFGLTPEGKFRTVAIDGVYNATDGGTTQPTGWASGISVFDLTNTGTPVLMFSVALFNSGNGGSNFSTPLRLTQNGGVAFHPTVILAAAGDARAIVAWHFEDNVGNS